MIDPSYALLSEYFCLDIVNHLLSHSLEVFIDFSLHLSHVLLSAINPHPLTHQILS